MSSNPAPAPIGKSLTPSQTSEIEKTVDLPKRPAPDPSLKAGIFRSAELRDMNSVGGLDRPGQAGPDPSNYFQDLHGPVLNNCTVVPIFWGSAWTNPKAPAPTVIQVYAAMASIVSGPYISGISQYRGIGPGHVFLANASRTPADPPANFKGSDIETLIGNCIDAGTVPAPDGLPGTQYLYAVFLPPGVTPNAADGGAHTFFSHKGINVHYAWIGYGTLDGISTVFSHEFVESCTDPEGSGFTFTSDADPGTSGWIEIGDVCQSYTGTLSGVAVQAYWSQKDKACIIPTLSLTPVPRWYRLGDQDLGHGILSGGLAVGSDNSGQLHLFGRGGQGNLLHLAQSGSTVWGNYASLGGYVLPDAFSVLANPDGRLEVVGIGTGNQVSHIWQTSPSGPWSAWNGLGGQGIGVPRLIRNSTGQLEAFIVGTDSQIWHIKQTSALDWGHAWVGLGAKVDTGLFVPPIMDVIANPDGRLEIFYQGTDSALWHLWQTTPNGAWTQPSRIGGSISLLSLARAGNGAIYAFVRGSDSNLYFIEQNSKLDWGGTFTRLAGGVAGSTLSAGTNKDGRLEVFYVGTGTDVQHVWQPNAATPASWSAAASLGGGGVQKVHVANNLDGRFELLVIGGDSYAWHIWQTAASNGWNY